jgi:hypothetical protein
MVIPSARSSIDKLFEASVKKVNLLNNIVLKRDQSIVKQEDKIQA